MASHTLIHALISNSGAIKKTGGAPALENFVVKLDDSGEIDPDFLPSAAISSKRLYIQYARDGTTIDQFLKLGEVFSNLSGARLVRAATLVGISVQNSASNTFDIEVRVNGSASSSATVSLAAQTGKVDAGVSVALVANDRLAVFCDGTSDDPVVLLQLEET